MFLNNYCYILSSYPVCSTVSILLALSTCILLILLMQSVNAAQFLNIKFLNIYLFFGIFVSWFCNLLGDFFETLVILSAILLPIKSLTASAVFWIAICEAGFIASIVDFLTLLTIFIT